jgi:hypothetical protein
MKALYTSWLYSETRSYKISLLSISFIKHNCNLFLIKKNLVKFKHDRGWQFKSELVTFELFAFLTFFLSLKICTAAVKDLYHEDESTSVTYLSQQKLFFYFMDEDLKFKYGRTILVFNLPPPTLFSYSYSSFSYSSSFSSSTSFFSVGPVSAVG